MSAADDPGAGRGRFRKGRSGNPGGRPRKQSEPPPSELDVVLDRKLVVTRGGEPREITLEEALQQRTLQDAFAGKARAVKQVLKWIAKREAWLAAKAEKGRQTQVVRSQSPDPDNADAAMLLLGIVRQAEPRPGELPDNVRLLLETWAAQAALDRRRGAAPLKKGEVADITRCTHEAGSLR
jgi:hypothetical protein